eukprot:TRINITY_DN7144_c0_g1_i1.p1 TRINITY_DN7144_c0_g1~~TRINITY_DN7144_c0_g1_i1.p1  ORF type:complete len:378 (-),score=52.06 TRINITY_DN7144_c0_g1_i1:51-1124(-)
MRVLACRRTVVRPRIFRRGCASEVDKFFTMEEFVYATDHVVNEKYSQAVPILERALTIARGIFPLEHPVNLHCLYLISLSKLRMGNTESAIKQLEGPISYTKSAQAKTFLYHCKTHLHLDLGEFAEMLQVAEEAANIDPEKKFLASHINLGAALIYQNEESSYIRSKEILDSILSAQTSDYERGGTLNNLGLYYLFHKNDKTQALKNFEDCIAALESLEHNSINVEALVSGYCNASIVHLINKDYSKSENVMETGLKKAEAVLGDSSFLPAYTVLAQMYMQQRKHLYAEGILNRATRICKDIQSARNSPPLPNPWKSKHERNIEKLAQRYDSQADHANSPLTPFEMANVFTCYQKIE